MASAVAQNLSDNEYQKAGREYEQQASAAMDAGDYDAAAKYADLAAAEYRKSREYADAQALKFRAANAINLAQQNITDIANGPYAKQYAKELAKAKAILLEARALYSAQKWADSRAKAMEALDALKGIKGVSSAPASDNSGLTLPRYYKVVSKPFNTDCFWRIAALPGIYANPMLWPKLWNANKDKMRDPENPNLIHPDTLLEIPSAKNEKREGTYDPAVTYTPLEQ